MFRTVKTSVQRTKQFVQEHKTLTAVGVGFVAGAYLTRKADIKVVSQMAHAWGMDAGQMENYADALEIEIHTRDEFITHTKQWIDFEAFKNGTLPEGQTYKKIFAEHLRETASA